MTAFFVTAHARQRYRDHLRCPDLQDEVVAQRIAVALGNIVSESPDGSGRGRLVRTAGLEGETKIRAILAPSEDGVNETVVTVLPSLRRSKGDRIAQRARRRFRRKETTA